MEFPELFVFDASGSEDDAASDLASTVARLGIEAPLVVRSAHGRRLAAALAPVAEVAVPSAGADIRWAAELGTRARAAGADAIVALGGGRCLDVAKLAAARAGVVVVTVPTQPSHDGICSPIAVVPAGPGPTVSLGAVMPRAVYLSLPTLAAAPAASVRAGIGDLLANPLALRDWALASERGLDKTDERAWELSAESFRRIEPYLDSPPDPGPELVRALADALVLSGMAMICAGTSRPASGAEHEISHAMDALYGGRAMHGEQVAFGCILSVALYGGDVAGFRARLRRLGLPDHPARLGLSDDDAARLVVAAPETRPGRFTILEDANLDETGAKALVAAVWGRG